MFLSTYQKSYQDPGFNITSDNPHETEFSNITGFILSFAYFLCATL